MAVFFSHLARARQDHSFGSLGRFGVIIFFVHTSFVLMASLQRSERSANSDIRLISSFWIRRFFRIYPLAILVVVAMAVFHIPAEPGATYEWIGLKGFISNLALVQNLTFTKDILSALWSLPLEVQMYVILPFAYFAVRGKRHYWSLALWILSVGLAQVAPRISDRLIVFYYAPCFTSGIVAFDLVRSKGWTFKLPAWVWPLGIAAAIMLFGPHDNVELGQKMYRAWALSLGLGVLFATVKEGRQNWLHEVFHWIAERSYGIYLSHLLVLWFVFDRMTNFPAWVRIMALLLGVAGIPSVLYVSLEKPLIRAGGYFAKRMLGHPSSSKNVPLAPLERVS